MDQNQQQDNMWCMNAKETRAYMGARKKLWIAFKVLATRAIHPGLAFQWAGESGGDFIVL